MRNVQAAGNGLIKLVTEVADLELQAAEAGDSEKPKLRKFSMTAYTGGAMRVAMYSAPVVIDLAGMKLNHPRRPILMAHDHGQIVGHTENVEIGARGVKVTGTVSGVGDAASQVVALADNGFPWQASVGALVEQIAYVDRGEKVSVNGRSFVGPLYVARQSTLREISFVALGADDNTSAKVAANLGGNVMEFDQWLVAGGFDRTTLNDTQLTSLRAAFDAVNTPTPPPPKVEAKDPAVDYRTAVANEAERVARVREICAQYGAPSIEVAGAQVSLEAHAIREGWTADKTELTALRASRPKAPAIHGGAPDINASVLEAAVCRAGNLSDVDKQFKPQVLEAADRHFRHGIGLQELILAAAAMAGYACRPSSIRIDLRGVLEAAFSQHALSGVLANTANKFLLQGFNYVEAAWRQVAAIGSVSDFKTVTRYRLTDGLIFEQLSPDGELEHGTLGEESFTNAADTFGRILSITRKNIIDDDLDALSKVPAKIGRGGALKLNNVFWTAFLNNASFYTAARKNYFDGATSALSATSLGTAVQMFRDQKDSDGNILGAEPKVLLVPTTLEVTADELYKSSYFTGGASKTPQANVMANRFPPVVSAYLSNSAFTGYSTTAWYLLADPQDIPVIEVVFLNGQQVPIVESADADFNKLGIQLRGYFDFGVALQDYLGGVKSKGAA